MKLKGFNAKQFLIEKGERVGLGAAGLVAVALTVYGLFMPPHGFFSGDPLKKAADLDKATQTVKNGMQNAKPGDADKPPPNAEDRKIPLDTSLVSSAAYAIPDFFHPGTLEGTKRRPPTVLLPEEALATATWVPLDVILMTDPSEEGTEGTKIYILKEIKGSSGTKSSGQSSGSSLSKGLGQFGAAGGMGLGAGGGITGRPGLGAGGGIVGRPGGIGGLSQPQTLDPLKPTYTMEPIALKDLGSLDKVHPARELRPLRMAIITASFPYKRQIEVFREAMRLKTASEVLSEKVNIVDPTDPSKQKSIPSFRFLGVDLERCEVDNTGKVVADWVPIDLGEAYKPWMFRAAKRFEPDSAKLAAVSPRGLVMPRLLQFRSPTSKTGPTSKDSDKDKDKEKEDFENHYPNLEEQLPKLAQTLEDLKPKLKDDNAPSMPEGFDTSGVNPFDPTEATETKGRPAGGGAAGGEEGSLKPPGSGRPVGTGGTKAPVGGSDSSNSGLIPEYCLLRVIDVTIEPGKIYQYRIKVRMGNPNEGRNDVADPSWSKDPELPSTKWFDVPQRVTVPPELIYYSVDQKELAGKEYDGPGRDERIDPSRETVLQIHRWLDQTRVAGMGSKPVAIGEWAIAERVIVRRGEYVDKIENVQMPVWNSSHDSFVLPADTHGKKDKKSTIQISFSHNLKDNLETVLVDFDGGRQSWKSPDPDSEDKDASKLPKAVDDVGAIDILLMTPEGKLIGRNSAADAQDGERLKRRSQVRQRVELVKKKQSSTDKPTKGGPFGDSGSGK
jgi:hypothetical protein